MKPFLGLSMKFDLLVSKLDTFFESRKKTEVIIIFALPIFLFGYFSVEIFYPQASKTLQVTEKRHNSILDQLKVFDTSNKNFRNSGAILEDLKKKNQKLKQEISTETEKNFLIKEKIKNNFKSLESNRENWSGYIYEVSDLATRNNVKIEYFPNTINQEAKVGEFDKLFSVSLVAKGNFQGVFHFLDELERSERISEITTLTLTPEKQLKVKLNIELWGIK